jgi:hypothetical protein
MPLGHQEPVGLSATNFEEEGKQIGFGFNFFYAFEGIKEKLE